MLITGVRFNKIFLSQNMQTQVQLSALQHHGIISMIEKGLNMLEGFGQNFSLSSPQTRLGCYHMGIDHCLCDDYFMLYTSSTKLAPATQDAATWVAVLDFP